MIGTQDLLFLDFRSILSDSCRRKLHAMVSHFEDVLLKRIRKNPSKTEQKIRARFEARFLKAIVRRAKKSKKGFHFIGFDKGLDGLPILFIHKKKIPGAAIKLLRKKAVKKNVLQGRLIFRDGRFVFMMKNNNVGKLRRNLKIYFGLPCRIIYSLVL